MKVTESSSRVHKNTQIYLKDIGATRSIPSSYADQLDLLAGYTQVFSGDITFNTTGWFEIILDSEFVYDGTGSISMVVTDFDDGSGTGSTTSGPYFEYSYFGDGIGRTHYDNSNYLSYLWGSTYDGQAWRINARFGKSGACEDINECATNNDNCNANATCTNTQGAFDCDCKNGFMGDGVTCNQASSPSNATCTTGGDGNRSCTCNSGYTGSISWNDSSDSWSGSCSLASCPSNSSGAPSCSCSSGYNDNASPHFLEQRLQSWGRDLRRYQRV